MHEKALIPEITQFTEHSLHSGDDVVHESSGDTFVHGRVLLCARLDVQEPDEGLDGDALNEHGPVDHCDRRRDKHGAVRNFLQTKMANRH